MGYNAQAEAALKTRIRLKCGSPDTTLLSADELDDALDEALEMINRWNPRLRSSTVTTVAYQQDYKIAYDGGGLSNFRCLAPPGAIWQDTSSGYSGLLDDNYDDLPGGLLDGYGGDAFDNPSLVHILYQKVREYDRAFGGSSDFVQKTDGAYLRLIPAPTSAGTTVPYFYFENRTLTDLESPFEEPLLKLATGACLLIMAARADLVTEVDHGNRKTKFGGKTMKERGEQLISDGRAAVEMPVNGDSV